MILVATLNHNQKKLTDNLVKQLRQSEVEFGLWVVDNGSKKEEKSHHTGIDTGENLFFGGGLDYVLEKFLKLENFEYLWFLNNDLIFNGNRIVSQIESIAIDGNYDLLSPAMTNSHEIPCHWRQMWNWYTGDTRDVKWIDFQAPLISRRLAEELQPIPQELNMGWGIDFLSGMICEQKGWKVGVTDVINMVHLDSRTLKDGKVEGWNIDSYSHTADRKMKQYFQKDSAKAKKFMEYRKFGENYNI